MSTPDEAFIAEVDAFLHSCDTAVFSVMRALNENESYETLLPPREVPIGPSADQAKAEAKTARDRKRRLAYHERQKLQREDLRRQVEEMTLQIDRMKKKREMSCGIPTNAWRTVAMQQLEARQAAEQENQTLQSAVQSQERLIQQCSQFIQQTIEARQLYDVIARQHKRIRLESSDKDIYETCMRELHTTYAQTDEIFQRNRVTGSQNSTWKVDTRTGYFEFLHQKTLEYDFQHASQRMRQFGLLLRQEEGRELYEGVEDPENTIALKFRISTRLPTGSIASAVQRVVGRQYKEKDRAVGVWRSFTEGEGVFQGMHSDETGWCVIKRTTDGKALLDIFIRNIPMHFSTAEQNRSAVEQFSHLVCNAGSEDLSEMTVS